MYVQIIEQTTFVHNSDKYVSNLMSSYRPVNETVDLPAFLPGGTSALSKERCYTNLSPEEMGLEEAEQSKLFMELHGFDLRLLILMSRTTRLVNVLDDHIQNATNSGLPASDVLEEAASLENEICGWTPAEPGTVSSLTDMQIASDAMEIIMPMKETAITMIQCHMVTAIHHALIIYFFRCVRSTNPLILQQYVGSVLENLEDHYRLKALYYPDARLGTIVWPSFIAACDATGIEMRSRAIACMRHAKVGGFRNAESAERVVKELWRRRDGGNVSLSWRDIIRDMDVNIVLT